MVVFCSTYRQACGLVSFAHNFMLPKILHTVMSPTVHNHDYFPIIKANCNLLSWEARSYMNTGHKHLLL